MKNPFARREAPTELPSVPDDVAETWRASSQEVVLRANHTAPQDDDRASADALAELVLGIVRGVREGAYGHSMPAGTSKVRVRLEVAVCDDDFGPYTRREAEDLVGRLEGVAPLALVTYPRGGAAPEWDDPDRCLRVRLETQVGDDDASTRVELRSLVQATLSSVTTEKVRAIVPADAGDRYPVYVSLTVHGTDAPGFGPASAELLDDVAGRLVGTRVQLAVTKA
jgi:hypothetical protein